MSPMTARIRSLAISQGGILPWKTKRMVGGTFTQVLPVPMTKPASVLPMPVANSPNAPAVQVWLSVPSSTSPGRVWPSSGRSEEHTSELQSHVNLVCRLLLEKQKKTQLYNISLKKKKNNKE